MPALKPGTIRLTVAEDAAITAAALADPDAQPLSDRELALFRVMPGRPKSRTPVKIATTIRFDADLLAALKASGRGWQTRVNEAMREWIKSHPAA
jgi:uncharacterized protein (DUF4415 family)